MDSRELVTHIINRQPVERIAFYDSFWTQTANDFHTWGIPEDLSLEDYFNFDIRMFYFDQSFLLRRQILEENDHTRIVTDEWGSTNREFVDHQTTPGLLGFAVKDRSSWEEQFKPKLQYHPDRIPWQKMHHAYNLWRDQGKYIVLSLLDPFECSWHKVGPEAQLILMLEEPEWLISMYEADTDLIEAAWEDMVSRGIKPDALWLFGDIAYRAGMFFSPRHYRAQLMPFHHRLCDLAHKHGSQVIYHSDGNISAVIPDLIQAGVDCLHPLEVKSGMDIRQLKTNFGHQIALMGNIDARLFQTNDRQGLELEISTKIPLAMQGSGYIYHSDHSIPPGTTLDTYTYGLERARYYGRYT